MCLAVKKEQFVERVEGTIFLKKAKNFMMSQGRDAYEEYGKPICPGCGIFMIQICLDTITSAKNLEDDEDKIEDELDGFEMVDNDEDDDMEEEDDDITNAIESSNSESENEFELNSKSGKRMMLNWMVLLRLVLDMVMSEKKRVSKAERRQRKTRMMMCARCHSLWNYGQVKNQAAKNLFALSIG